MSDTEMAFRTVLVFQQYTGRDRGEDFSDAIEALYAELVELAEEYGVTLEGVA